MTSLNGHPLRRETGISVRSGGSLRPLIVEAYAGYVVLRQKGRRKGYAVAWDAVFHLGAKQEARERAAEKKEKRRGK